MSQEQPPEAELKTKLSKIEAPGLPPAMKLGLAGVAVLAVIAGWLVLRPAKPAAPATTTTTTETPPVPSIAEDLRALNVRVDAPVNLEQFGAAIAMLEEARRIHDAREWRGPIDDRMRSLRQVAEDRYQELKTQAVAARQRGAAAEVDKIRKRVAQWGMDEWIEAFERDLEAVRIASPIPVQGLRFIPPSPGARIHRRLGVAKDQGVEGVPHGPSRVVGYEGGLFQAPSDGEVQMTFVTDAVQSIQIRFRIVGERGRLAAFDHLIRNAESGKPVRVTAPFRQFTEAGIRGLPPGSIVKELHVSGQDSKVAFRVTELLVVKRRD
jgi:hypothetical protein